MFIRIPITGVLSIIKVLADGAICAKVFCECRTKTPNAEFQTLVTSASWVRHDNRHVGHRRRPRINGADHVRKVLTIYPRCALVEAAPSKRMSQNILTADLVVQRVEAIVGFCLRFRV